MVSRSIVRPRGRSLYITVTTIALPTRQGRRPTGPTDRTDRPDRHARSFSNNDIEPVYNIEFMNCSSSSAVRHANK